MIKFAEKLENKAIVKWGFENWKTIVIFKLTESLHKG